MVNILRVSCRMSTPDWCYDGGVSNEDVYILATKMSDRSLISCIQRYWSETESSLIGINSVVSVPMPASIGCYTHIATYDGSYGKGFIVIDNPIARRLLRFMRSGSWDRTFYLCEAYNWVTLPSRLMNVQENKACERFARLCRKKLAGKNFREDENGCLWSTEDQPWK